MLKIYGTKSSSNVQKVLWCCGELGLPFERLDVAETFGAPKAPGYLALNPNGLIPTIDDGGFILWESNAIVRYLCATHAMGTFCPTDARARADQDRWMDWQQTSLVIPIGALFRDLLRTPREALTPEALAAMTARANHLWGLLDTHLANRAYVGGAAPTMADFAFGNAIHRWYKFPIEHAKLDRLRAWYDRLCERPAYRQHIASV
jgi:glutathione S-transferase